MKIVIDTPTEESPEKVFEYFQEKCIDAFAFGEFTIEIEDTKLKYHYNVEKRNKET